jgi:diacylglycerol kinase family enzyme
VQTSAALGIIPCGSGNGLARHLQIPLNVKRDIDIINTCNISNLDYGKINDKPFFCTCGVGFDAFVSKKFAEGGKRGFLSYVENTLREGVRYKSEKYTIEFEDHSEKREAFLIACANASQYGNNAYIAPLASMEDGLMDVIIMEPFYTIESALVLVQMFTKSLHKNSHVKVFKSSKIKITRPTEGAVHCDGDPFVMGKDITVEVFKGKFRVVTPLVEELSIREEGRKALKNLADICLEILNVKHKK